MKCSLLALLSCRFGVLFSSLAVACLLCRDIVKKECALAWRMTCARFPSACLRTLRWGARLRPFRLSGVPSYRFLLLYAILRLTLYRIATAALFLHPLSCTLALAGFRRYPVHGELLSACLRTLLWGARLRSFRPSGVPSCRFLLLYAVLRLTLCRIAAAALFLHPLSCALALAASGVILSMKCSLLALLSCRFGVLFFSLPVTRPLRRDIVKKECARAVLDRRLAEVL